MNVALNTKNANAVTNLEKNAFSQEIQSTNNIYVTILEKNAFLQMLQFTSNINFTTLIQKKTWTCCNPVLKEIIFDTTWMMIKGDVLGYVSVLSSHDYCTISIVKTTSLKPSMCYTDAVMAKKETH